MLNLKTVLVESTDCSDDDDDDIATYYRMPVVCLPHNPQATHPYLYCLRLEKSLITGINDFSLPPSRLLIGYHKYG